MELPPVRTNKAKGILVGEPSSSSASSSSALRGRTQRPPAPFPSFKVWGVPVPLPEPKTPRTTTERRRQQKKLQKLWQQATGFQEEIRVAQGAPRASEACRDLVQFVLHKHPDPLVSGTTDRWDTAQNRRRFSFCWCCF